MAVTTLGGDLQELVRRARPERTLITTYCASLSYLESGLLNALREHGRPSIRVLVDAQPFANCLGEVGIRFPGVRYEPYAVTAARGFRFHPKTYALLTETAATIVVASANLTVPGFRSNWEVFDVLEVRRDAGTGGQPQGDVAALASYTRFIKRLVDGAVLLAPEGRRAVGEIVDDLEALLAHAGSDAGENRRGPWFLHSLDEPLLDQIERLVPATEIERVTAYSPYYDPGAEAVRRVLRAFPNAKRVNVVLDPPSEAAFNGRALHAHSKRLHVYRASSPDTAATRFLHAKLLVLETATGAWTVCGSANLTLAGLCGAAAPQRKDATGNVEAVTVRLVDDSGLAKRLLAVVPKTLWAGWPEATVTAELTETARDEHAINVVDAELDSGYLRCTVTVASWSAGGGTPGRAVLHLDHPDGRLSLPVETIDADGEFVVLETRCEDSVFVGSDQPARIEVEAFDTRGSRSGRAWMRRPVELRRSAASVSMRERLRPLRQTPTPRADTLLEVHNELCSLLSRLGDRRPASPSSARPSGAPSSSSRSSESGGDLINVDELLSDEILTSERACKANERPHDQLRAIGDALRTHLSAPVGVKGESPRRTASAPEDQPKRQAHDLARRPRRLPGLNHEHASQLSQLSATFSTAVRAASMSPESVATIIEMAEPVGTVVLCADVLRAPPEDKTSVAPGPRAALRDALVAWWTALLGIIPGSDGTPRGFLIRAWASDETTPLLQNALRESAGCGSGGLAGLASGLAAAVAVLRVEGCNESLLDDAVIGLAVLSDRMGAFRSTPWSKEARDRLMQGTSWWPVQELDTIIDEIWNAAPPPPPVFMEQLGRWWALASGSHIDASPAPATVLKAVARVRQVHSDPIATLDSGSRRTTCCPSTPTHTAFPGEVARAWPQVATCPNCGRLVAPAEVLDPRTRRVVEWWNAHQQDTASEARLDQGAAEVV